MGVVRDEWLAHGLSTRPADRAEAEAGVREAYEAAGLEAPHVVVWLESPLAGVIGAQCLRLILETLGRPGDQVRDQVRNQVFGDQVGDQVGAQVRDQVWAQVGAQVGDQLYRSLAGSHDASWTSFFDFFDRVGLGDVVAPMRGVMRVARAAGWWWPFGGAALLTERHSSLHRDDQGRIHNETGPAIGYPDGWGVWAVHGVRVPQRVVEAPETLSAREIADEENAEVRRIMLDRFGPERFIRELPALKVQADDFGTLWRANLEDDESLVMVEVVNSTPEPDGSWKTYWLRVPPDVATAHQAVAWTFGMEPDDYHPAKQT